MMTRTVKLISFGYKYNTPTIGRVLDVRRLANPHHLYANKTGKDKIVSEWLLAKPSTTRFIRDIINMILADKSLDLIYIGCYGGKHRSVVVVEQLAIRLERLAINVEVRHRDLTR